MRMLPTKPVRSRLTSAGRLLRPSWTRWPCTTTLDLVLRVRARLRLLGQLSRRLMRICWARPSSSTSSTNRSLSLSRRPKVLLAGDTAARGRLWFPSLLSVFFCRRRRGRRQRSWADVYVRGTDGSIRRPSALERRLAEGRAGASGSRGRPSRSPRRSAPRPRRHTPAKLQSAASRCWTASASTGTHRRRPGRSCSRSLWCSRRSRVAAPPCHKAGARR